MANGSLRRRGLWCFAHVKAYDCLFCRNFILFVLIITPGMDALNRTGVDLDHKSDPVMSPVVLIVCVCILVCSQVMCTSQITVTFDLAHVVIYILHGLCTCSSSRHHPDIELSFVCSTRVFMRCSHHSLWDHCVHDYTSA